MEKHFKNIAHYYDQTLVHYCQHWHLNKCQALHYGLWDGETKHLNEALLNTNKKIALEGKIQSSMNVLDAGCGVGGTALFLASSFGCKVRGITLSAKQLQVANQNNLSRNLKQLVSFELKNYENTGYPNASFDVIYGIESICHASEKLIFLQEAFRLLKPHGKLLVLDFFRKNKIENPQEKNIMHQWLNRWAIESLDSTVEFRNKLLRCGFQNVNSENLTHQIIPSAKKLYRAAFLGYLPSKIYAIYNKKVSPYAKDHYKSVYYQYKALQKNLWTYCFFTAEKS